MTGTSELARYCTEELSYEGLPDEVVWRAKEFLLDSLGIAVRAAAYDSSAVVLGAMDHLGDGGGSCTVWGTGGRAGPERAAFLNGTFVHTPEIDDTHSEGIIHPAAPVIPAVVAAGEHDGADGADVLAGIVAGYEAAVRVALALPSRAHMDKGFHTTATCGVFGGTAGIAAAVGLSREELESAFGVNVSQAAGSRQWGENGAWTKRIHPGMGARNAVLAAALARSGFRGSADAITGTWGFLRVYGDDPQPERLVDGLGESFEISNTGIKPYACCRYHHTPIDVTLQAVRDHDISAEEVERVRLVGSRPLVELSQPVERKTRPSNLVDAQFSPQYAVAVAIADRAAGVDQYDPARFDEPTLEALMDVVTVEEDPGMTARHPAEWPARVEIETARGTFTAEQSLPRGDPDYRLSRDELEEKFRTLARRLDPSVQDELIATVWNLEDAGLEPLGRLLRQEPLAAG